MNIYDIKGKIKDSTRFIVKDIPTIHFTGVLPTSKDDGNKKLSFSFFEGAERFNGFCTLKVQGNSTTRWPKKNFTIKFYNDAACKDKMYVNFNDWRPQTKFVLKADWIDITHARNIVSCRLWSDVISTRQDYDKLPKEYRSTPNNCVIDGFIVRIFVNGVYFGRYSLNIPKDEWMFNMDADNPSHCVLCGENYQSGCFLEPAVIDGTDWTDELRDETTPSIVSRWNDVISFVMNSSDEVFAANLNYYINVNSLVDYYVFAHSICGIDIFGKNQIFLTYDLDTWYASVYDLDSTWGLYWDGSELLPATHEIQTSNRLFGRLAPLFKAQIKARYASLRSGALSNSYMKNLFKEWCDVSSPELVQQDYAPETASGAFVDMPLTAENNYEQIASFIDDRMIYMDDKINNL